jgi:hypothetical protein
MARQPRRLAGIGAADIPDAAAFDAYTGPARELTVDPVRGILALHDGTTAGGVQFEVGGGGGGGGLPTRFWQGYTHSNNLSVPNTRIDIAAGSARDSTDTADIINLPGTIDCTMVGANGLDAGALANNTWYYTFAISTAAGATAFLASTSPTAPTLPGSYTKFRRIGSFKTNGSAQILAFTHVHDTWYWSVVPRDISTGATVGTSFITSASLSVPRIYGVTALIATTAFHASLAFSWYIMPTFVPDTAENGFIYNLGSNNGGSILGRVMVDSLARVKYRSSTASTTVVIDTAGWVDPL